MRNLYTLGISQGLSVFGSEMLYFALPIIAYQSNGSALSMGIMLAVGYLPKIFLAPFSGYLVDRQSKQFLIVLFDFLQALTSITCFISIVYFQKTFLALYFLQFVNGCLGVFHQTALQAFVIQTTERSEYGRANALMTLIESIASVGAPVMASLVLLKAGISGVILIDLSTFLIAVVAVGSCHFNKNINQIPVKMTLHLVSFTNSMRQVGKWIIGNIEMLKLIFLTSAINFLLAIIITITYPAILSYQNGLAALGSFQSAAIFSQIISGATLTLFKFKTSERKLLNLVLFLIIPLLLAIVLDHLWILGLLLILVYALVPYINNINRTIWAHMAPAHLLGRLISFRRALTASGAMLGFIMSGFLVDYLKKMGNESFNGVPYKMLIIMTGIVFIAVAYRLSIMFSILKPLQENECE